MTEGSTKKMKSYVHLVCGNLLDVNSELKIKEFPILKLDSFSLEERIVFRFLFIKERQILLFGHNKASKVSAVYFGFDGSINEIEGIELGSECDLRGIVLARDKVPNKYEKKETLVWYQQRLFKVPRPLRLFLLNSKGGLDNFFYFDTRYAAPVFSMFTHIILMEKFVEQEKLFLKKLIGTKKSNYRSKSQNQKKVENKKRKRGSSAFQVQKWQNENETL